LRNCPLSSLGAIVLLHVVEHLYPNELLELIALAHERLAVGGRLVLETPNPQSLYVFARAFWLDPTHVKPVHPVYLDFVLRQAGFNDVYIEWTALPREAEQLSLLPGDEPAVAAANDNVRRLNDLVFAAQNYRIIATR
jgi:O-antigen chain-terminating methyltransferase